MKNIQTSRNLCLWSTGWKISLGPSNCTITQPLDVESSGIPVKIFIISGNDICLLHWLFYPKLPVLGYVGCSQVHDLVANSILSSTKQKTESILLEGILKHYMMSI